MDIVQENNDLYPSIQPYLTDTLNVGEGHCLYWEQSGNPNGIPVLFLHGGPGAGCSPNDRRFFDPKYYRIVLFDQRGSGRSTPYASVKNNTTQLLIRDIETLRVHLKINSWLIFGGSWGVTLALAYGVLHADRCLGFILRGVFLGTIPELNWFIHGMKNFFPQAHRDLIEFLPVDEQKDFLKFYNKRLTDPDQKVHLPAAMSWSRYEAICSTLLPNPYANTPPPKRNVLPPNGKTKLAISRIETHYFVNNFFLQENFLFENIEKLKGLKAIIIQGRYDIICPIITAEKLARQWPGGNKDLIIKIINSAGHSAMEPEIRGALVKATDNFKSKFLT